MPNQFWKFDERKNTYGEYVVKCWDKDEGRLPDGDYFTNDKQDAIDTCKLLNEGKRVIQKYVSEKDKAML